MAAIRTAGLANAVLDRGELSYPDASDIASTAMANRPVPVLAEGLRSDLAH